MKEFLDKSSERHGHLCPRQVIGVRMGLKAAKLFDFSLPQEDKRLLAIVETDGCFADGIEVSTGCSVGHRTLRIRDFGKVAATFVDTKSKRAFRIVPKKRIRYNAIKHSHGARNHWEAMLLGYQRMPDDELLSVQAVSLNMDIDSVVSRAGVRVNCKLCEEEIINEREIIMDSKTLCQHCAGDGYYETDDFAQEKLHYSPATLKLEQDSFNKIG